MEERTGGMIKVFVYYDPILNDLCTRSEFGSVCYGEYHGDSIFGLFVKWSQLWGKYHEDNLVLIGEL